MIEKNEISSRFIQSFNWLKKEGIVNDKAEFAEKLGISSSMVTEISKGRSSVGVMAIQNIVSVFDISSEWLLTGKGYMLNPVGLMTEEEMSQIDQEEKDGKWKTNEVKSIDDSLSQLLDVIREQAEEIGRLKEKIAHLEREKEKDVLDAQNSTGALAG